MSIVKMTLTSAHAEKEIAEPSSCPACAASNCTDAGPSGPETFRRRRCRECQLLFSSPMQAADAAWYASSWIYGLRAMNGNSMGEGRRVPWNFAQALRRLGPGKGSKLLDVGCAEGQFLRLAAQAGYEITGLDFNPASVEMARKLLGVRTVYPYSVEELGERFRGAQFDVVTIFEVLEHTADPYETVRSIHNLLKPGGRLFLSVPGSRRWPGFFHPEVDAPPHHLTLWSEPALVRLLERAGFHVQGVDVKPLGVEDLGIHLKWRCHEAVRELVASFAVPRPSWPCPFTGGTPVARPHDTTPVRKFLPQHSIGPATEKNNAGAGQNRGLKKRGAGMIRDLAMLGLLPVCWLLRLNPRAGGFTLSAHCEKA